MRITNKMLSNNFLRDMNTNLNNLSKIQNQMASGNQINKASDDPVKAAKIMQMNSDINSNDQYNANIKNTTNWLDVTDGTLDKFGVAITRINELLISSGNANDASSQSAIKDEINQKVEELAGLLNTNFDGKYIFGGTRGTNKPVDAATKDILGNAKLMYAKVGGGELDISNLSDSTDLGTIDYNQINSKLQVEVSQGVTMDYNVTASQVINYGDGDNNLMKLLGNITSHLGSTEPTEIKKLANEDLTGIQAVMTNVLKLRSEVGAKQNRMESAESRNTDQNLNMIEIRSSIEDINITEKAMEFATMQTIYLASLQTSAKVIQPTLLDYL
ncbi:MAG: flagellar hook-associated protein FlgL [Clostridium sp.]|uniref:flagellar hook-associated protein FlgL n=1 Tax=Clostridium sp. TaxID=1506 RepID=UPI003D6CECFB